MSRTSGRRPDELRELEIQPDYLEQANGSALISFGKTRVLCTASIEEGVPRWLAGRGRGWLTAEYSMLPASTGERRARERARPDGRSVEIQRLIGRSLRAVVNRRAFPGRTIWVDCDVICADGGTRTASINGAYVALHACFHDLQQRGALRAWPLTDSVRSISVGLHDGQILVDLTYYEDSQAEVDMNLVMTGAGRLVEMGGGAERGTFSLEQMQSMIEAAQEALGRVGAAQEAALSR